MSIDLEKIALAQAKQVRLMIFDVDGVLTDGSLNIGPQGEVFKTFNALDGHGIKLLQQAGITTAIISARHSPSVTWRAKELGINHVWLGVENKTTAFLELSQQQHLAPEYIGMAGDDVIDLPIMMRVGFAATVINAHPEVKARAHYVASLYGGHGAVRQICDFILQAQDQYQSVLKKYVSSDE